MSAINGSLLLQEGFIVKIEKVEVQHCDRCPQAFTNSKDFDAHIARHQVKDVLHKDRVLEYMLSAKVLLERVQIYQCGKCSRGFLHYIPLNEHQKVHSRKRKKILNEDKSESKPHKCEECGLRFVELSTLTTHLKVHEPFPHICHCGIGFYQAKDLETHDRLVHSKIEFSEAIIKSEFALKPKKKGAKLKAKKKPKLEAKRVVPKRKSEKPTQIKTQRCSSFKVNCKLVKNKDGDYECSFCGEIYKDATQFFAHVNSHTGRWPHVCDKCPYGSKTLAMLIVHKKKHEGGYNGIIKCDVCAKKSSSTTHLAIHMLIHTGEKQYTCTLCSKSFTQQGALKIHLRRHQGTYTDKCEQCNKLFVDRGAFKRHLRTHSGLKPYNCESCGKAFSDPSAFKRHNRIHSGVKPYRCRYCPKVFSDNSAWITHMRRHEGYTSMHPCVICNKQLATHNNLKAHLKTHLKKNTFECDYCGVIKHRKEYLGMHIRNVHLKAKNYQCSCCENMFHTKRYLEAHIKRAHVLLSEELVCPICGEMFKNEDLMKNHIDNRLCKDIGEYDPCRTRLSHKDSVKSDIMNHSTRCKTCKKKHSLHSQHECITCCMCNRYFKTELVMKRHFLRHFHNRKHVCPECPKRFYEVSSLETHRSESHGAVSCDHCGEVFNGKRGLRTHIWTKHMLSMYCNVCLKRFYEESEFVKHKRGCMKKRTCKFCKLKVPKVSLEAHSARHVNETFKCDRCWIPQVYKHKFSLYSHMRSIHGVGK